MSGTNHSTKLSKNLIQTIIVIIVKNDKIDWGGGDKTDRTEKFLAKLKNIKKFAITKRLK